VLINPISGAHGRPDAGRRRAARATAVLDAAGVEVQVSISERPGHLTELARAAAANGADRVIAWGGDGTVNEVGRALACTATPLGIVRAGSGNGLARALGIPRRPDAALRRAISATPRPIDAGEIGGHLFFNIAGLGFDARVAHAFSLASGRRGLRRYVRTIARELSEYRPRRYRISIGGDVAIDVRAFLLAVANGSQWGNGATIAPHARLDDGLLDVVIGEADSTWQVVRHIPLLFTGGIERSRAITTRRAASVDIEADEPLCIHADGEIVEIETRSVSARVHPGALRVCGNALKS
jgi:YegS/Rv2252/BmrU family lipid kinase